MSGARIPVAVVNGTGYGGVELLRLLRTHPGFALVEVTARSEAGQRVADVFPHLGHTDLRFSEAVREAELVFLALPDAAAAALVPQLLAEGRRVVDLSGAYRLRSAALFARAYGYEHPAPHLLAEAVYGLPEAYGEALRQARLVACPGCYPTAAVLALLPALARALITPDVIVDAKSGLSGAGRSLRLSSHFSEANEDVSAYGLEGHRHAPEMTEVLADAAGLRPRLTFTPHLVPMTRGILATCYGTLAEGTTAAEVRAAYADYYAEEPFVRVVDHPPHTKWTLGSNSCLLYARADEALRRLVVVSALDNLVKGAAGQAIQCANRMYGLEQTLGLPQGGVYP